MQDNRRRQNVFEQYPDFGERIQRLQTRGHKLSRGTYRYYKYDATRNDSRSIPGQYGNPSIMQEVMTPDQPNRPNRGRQNGWRSIRKLGQGGFGKVMLWERQNPDGVGHQSLLALYKYETKQP